MGAIGTTHGDVALIAPGSILNGDARSDSNIDATNITLVSQQGSIGASTALNVNTTPAGVLQAAAAEDVNIAETDGT